MTALCTDLRQTKNWEGFVRAHGLNIVQIGGTVLVVTPVGKHNEHRERLNIPRLPPFGSYWAHPEYANICRYNTGTSIRFSILQEQALPRVLLTGPLMRPSPLL